MKCVVVLLVVTRCSCLFTSSSRARTSLGNLIDDSAGAAGAGSDSAELVGDSLTDVVKSVHESVKSAVNSSAHRTKPLMKKINIVRADMCFKRDDLMKDEDCMKFLAKLCSAESTGEGICAHFGAMLEAKCLPSKKNSTAHLLTCPEYHTMLDPLKGDSDEDGDGYNNSIDAMPFTPTEWSDMDGDGIGDNSDPDRDGDGVDNDQDAFPDDPKEWSDMDGDGIGDNSDPDRDGDGVDNDQDAFPDDPNRPKTLDSDSDGIPDVDDHFPHDPSEWKDSDGDGVGDSADAYPLDPHCSKDPCHHGSKESTVEEPNTEKKASNSTRAVHGKYTWTGDWMDERPLHPMSKSDVYSNICAEHPENKWCQSHHPSK